MELKCAFPFRNAFRRALPKMQSSPKTEQVGSPDKGRRWGEFALFNAHPAFGLIQMLCRFACLNKYAPKRGHISAQELYFAHI